jgi:hypothetical protein
MLHRDAAQGCFREMLYRDAAWGCFDGTEFFQPIVPQCPSASRERELGARKRFK